MAVHQLRHQRRQLRILVVVRHAKAERSAPRDHDRRLTERGRADAAALAPAVCAVLAATPRGRCTALVSSAARAVETWRVLATALPADLTLDERTEPALYGAGTDDLVGLLASLGDDVDSAVVVGHNPTLESLVGDLAGEGAPEALDTLDQGLKTAAAAVLTYGGSWGDLGAGTWRLEALEVGRAVSSRRPPSPRG